MRRRSSTMHLTSRRSRRLFVASALTLIISAVLLGLIGATRWRGQQAVQSDTQAAITQLSQQLIRSLHSRRGTLTFLRDTLDRRPDLTPPQLEAMGYSAVKHTRHLLGVGLIRAQAQPVWWSGPHGLRRALVEPLDRSIVRRTALRGIWRVPSTFVTADAGSRPLLVMLEPLRTVSDGPGALVGVFDVKLLLEDFLAGALPQPRPVQVLDGETVLYRSTDWQLPDPSRPPPIIQEQPTAVDAARWTLQMQPGSTSIVRTLSWLNVLLIGLSAVAGLGVIGIIWILAARTWILQRAVARRTSALRRTTERLRQLAATDELTGLHNRRFFLERWEREYERAKRYQRPLACLMVDVNGFKQVNDRLGHLTGDLVLKQVAQELRALLRQSDILARFGGDEFVIALPETGLAQAEQVADKLRQIRVPVPSARDAPSDGVSLSVGISRIEAEDETASQVLQAADQSLYAWKHRTYASQPPQR